MSVIEDLQGKTLKDIKIERASCTPMGGYTILTEDSILFTTNDDEIYKMYHEQQCYEDVYIEDIVGDVNDLIGAPLVMAEEVVSEDNPKPDANDSWQWTFYKFGTVKGYVTIRWFGTSNGYYSEAVSFTKIR